MIHCENETFKYQMPQNIEVWSGKEYIGLLDTIKAYFVLKSTFTVNGNEGNEMDDIDDIKEEYEELDDSELLHLHVGIEESELNDDTLQNIANDLEEKELIEHKSDQYVPSICT